MNKLLVIHRTLGRALSFLLLASPVLFAPACDRPSQICDLVCECEHCNDVRETVLCEQVSAFDEVAEIYGCTSEWTAYLDCFENEGTCDEEEANYTTREEGACNATASSGIACTNNSDCLVLGFSGATCDNMVCTYTACADNGGQPGQPCMSNSDCPGGNDKCEDQSVKLAECLDNASDTNYGLPINFSFD